MKARNVLVVLLLLCFSCGTKTVSYSEKEKIQKEVKEVMNTIIEAAETANVEPIIASWLDSPDFSLVMNGNISNYQQAVESAKSYFNAVKDQKCNPVSEKFIILDNSTVLYLNTSEWVSNFKDGRIINQSPWITQSLLKKINGTWKVVLWQESGTEKLVANPEAQKELNQIELHKQFIGKWQASFGKDTICTMDIKPFGTGLINDFKYVTAGKAFREGIQLYGFSQKTGRYLMVEQEKGWGSSLLSVFFVSKSRWLMIPYSFALYPDNSPIRWEFDIVSPDQINYFEVKDNKAGEIRKFIRIK